MTLKDVSRRQNLSHTYLWQLVTPLKSAGIVSALPGVNGGYLLSRSLRDISLRDLVEAVEGASFLLGGSEGSQTSGSSAISTEARIWQEVAARFEGVLESITLEDLTKKERMRRAAKAAEYCI